MKNTHLRNLNKNIDTPMFNEKTEKDALYQLLLKTMKDMADDKKYLKYFIII